MIGLTTIRDFVGRICACGLPRHIARLLPPKSAPTAIFALSLALLAPLRGAAPLLDEPLPAAGEAPRVTPAVPVGKVLLFPITATDADGDALSFKVKSSNPKILVRAKSGNPLLKLEVEHADGGVDDPAYAGEMVFVLFRDWLPITTGYITGMAQAGFYDNLLFHRVADLGGGQGTTGFIFQGGDPLGSGGGGPGMTGSDAATSWKFQNEFHTGTLFTGRGQLAMANAGTQTSYTLGGGGSVIAPDYTDTNGSQFFVTDGQPRHLDFNHNIFGQLVRGWDVLLKMKATKTTSSKPDKDLKIKKASVLPGLTDAVLVISAMAPGSAQITVTAVDPGGGQSTKTFTVNAVTDTTNNQPFLQKLEPVSTLKNTPAIFGLRGVDLEFDYIDYAHSILPALGEGAHGTLLAQSGNVAGFQPDAGYAGRVNLGFGIRQYDVGPGGFNPISDYTNCFLGIGDRGARGEAVTIEGAPGIALAGVVVGRVQDLDAAGAPANFTATINWGDGTKLETASIARSTGAPGSSIYAASGSHVYAKAGIYPVVVEFIGNHGTRATARSTALIRTGPLRANGEKLDLTSARVVNRLLATFTDAASTRRAADYAAEVDWGDGLVARGIVALDARSGRFLVRGTHGYVDSEPFAVRVRIWKKSAPTEIAEAWTTVHPRFTAKPHLPPFPHPKLTIAWNSGPAKSRQGVPGPDYQVSYNGVFVIINTGNRPVGASKLRFWLSDDKVVNATGPNADAPVPVNGQPFLKIIGFPAGGGGSGSFVLKLPKGASGGGKYLLSETVYSDPIADHDGSVKVVTTGPLPPTVLVTPTTGLQTTEAGGTATFTVVLDTPPTTPTVPIATITAGNPVSIDTASPHGLATGAEVLISSVTGSDPNLNGIHTITVVDADTFTIALNVTAGGTGGLVQVNPKVVIPLESSLITEGRLSFPVAISHIAQGFVIDTATPHGLATGDEVTIAGVTGGTQDINGTVTVSVADEDTFAFSGPGNGVPGSGGTVTRVPKLRFTLENWNVPQTVTITGVDDAADDGNKPYKITIKAAASPDPLYNGTAGGEVNVVNLDNDDTPAP